jgi:hypothetical protein
MYWRGPIPRHRRTLAGRNFAFTSPPPQGHLRPPRGLDGRRARAAFYNLVVRPLLFWSPHSSPVVVIRQPSATKLDAQISAAGLVVASAGLGALYAFRTGFEHGLALAGFMTLMAVALGSRERGLARLIAGSKTTTRRALNGLVMAGLRLWLREMGPY